MTKRLMRHLAIAALLPVSFLTSACDSQSRDTGNLTGPSSPSPVPGTNVNGVNVTGTWVFTNGALVVTWTLTQTGSAVSGTTRIVDPNNAYYGQGVSGTISGSVTSAAFTYTQTHPVLLVANCTESDSGQLTFEGATRMTGTNTEVNTCKSSPRSAVVTFEKK
jgi:hypothetical protein